MPKSVSLASAPRQNIPDSLHYRRNSESSVSTDTDRVQMPTLPNPAPISSRNLQRIGVKVLKNVSTKAATNAMAATIVGPLLLGDRVERECTYYTWDRKQQYPMDCVDHRIPLSFLEKVQFGLPSSAAAGAALGAFVSAYKIATKGVNAYENNQVLKVRNKLKNDIISSETSDLARNISDQLVKLSESSNLYHKDFKEYASEMIEYIDQETKEGKLSEGESLKLQRAAMTLYQAVQNIV